MKKIMRLLVITIVLLLLVGCKDGNHNVPKKSYPNRYAAKSLLIIGKSGQFKNKVVERVVGRLRKSYEITIDDYDNIQRYSFYDYNAVLLVESQEGGKFPRTEKYLANYGGVNNILFFGTVNKREEKNQERYRKRLKVNYYISGNDMKGVRQTSNRLVSLIRKL